MSVEIGEVVAGRVVKILRYGAIVELEGGGTGLVHISEIAPEFVVAVEDHLREGDEVRVKVLGMREPGRYDLSIKQAEHADAPREPRRFRRRPVSASFERRLDEFMKASNRRQSDLNRGKSGKKRGRH
ncbi:MAG: S1 RNA-binding domain-containing protein [Armatimonadetes bacterium]|nr:S1 RNA-binding domain-containing protein [Armatimonadota bacterium]